jgi:hypothetical protein
VQLSQQDVCIPILLISYITVFSNLKILSLSESPPQNNYSIAAVGKNCAK